MTLQRLDPKGLNDKIDRSTNQTVSVVIRTMSGRLSFLDHALFSVSCNDYPEIEIIIVVQSEQNDYYHDVVTLTQSYIRPGLQIKVLQNCTGQDERAKNLNLGIASSTGKYLGFLDDDDILYPHHLSTLIEVLENHPNVAWTYSDVLATFCDVDATGNLYIQSRQCFFKRAGFSYLELWHENFIPLHSYLIDRSRVTGNIIQFDESFTVLEDYSFLLKFAADYPPIYHPEVTCEYRFRMDGSNSTCLTDEKKGVVDAEKQKPWDMARARIYTLKQELPKFWTFKKRLYFKLSQFKIKLLTYRNKIISVGRRVIGKGRRVVSPIASPLKRWVRSRLL